MTKPFNLEVVLVMEELRVISFDRFQIKMPSSVAYDDLVRVHLAYLKHHLTKKRMMSSEYQLPDIMYLPPQAAPASNEEKSSFFPQGGRYDRRPPEAKDFSPSKNNKSSQNEASGLGKRQAGPAIIP